MADEDLLPTAREIIATHEEIEETYDMKFRGARVGSPLLALRDILDEVREYDGVYLRAACLLRKNVTEHIWEDGNKRTAWTTTLQYLGKHGLEPAEQRHVVITHVLRSIRSYDVEELAEWLETGDIDRSQLNP